MSEWPAIKVGKYVTRRSEKVSITPGQEYSTMGVRWYGKGAYLRTASRPQTKTLSKAREGDFVFCRIDTQNGPFSVVTADLDGTLVTNEFPLYSVNRDELDARFLALYFSGQTVRDRINKFREGRDGRARWKEADFESWEIPQPPLLVQHRIVEIMIAVGIYIDALTAEESALTTLIAAMRQSLLSKHPRVPLKSLCEIRARLVDPTNDNYADLIHIGVDAIEKGTGRITGTSSARDDGVISGKYLVGKLDVVYSKIRPALRKAAFPGYVALCSADAYPLTPFEATPPQLLHEVLLEDDFTAQVTALSTRLKMPKVNRQELFSTTVAMPDTEVEQKHVVDTLGGIRAQLDALAAELDRGRTAQEALLDALLTRKIEVSY